jgi:hypothetical protein
MDAPDPDLAACGHYPGPEPVTGADGLVRCCIFCDAVARPAVHLKLVLAEADRVEAEQAELRRLNGRALHASMLNGKRS